ncbi:hypothetical protein SeMB42_g07950, partial [Synchytrium endobioticum]
MVNIVRGYLEHDERPTYLKPPSKDKNAPMKRKADEGGAMRQCWQLIRHKVSVPCLSKLQQKKCRKSFFAIMSKHLIVVLLLFQLFHHGFAEDTDAMMKHTEALHVERWKLEQRDEYVDQQLRFRNLHKAFHEMSRRCCADVYTLVPLVIKHMMMPLHRTFPSVDVKKPTAEMSQAELEFHWELLVLTAVSLRKLFTIPGRESVNLLMQDYWREMYNRAYNAMIGPFLQYSGGETIDWTSINAALMSDILRSAKALQFLKRSLKYSPVSSFTECHVLLNDPRMPKSATDLFYKARSDANPDHLFYLLLFSKMSAQRDKFLVIVCSRFLEQRQNSDSPPNSYLVRELMTSINHKKGLLHCDKKAVSKLLKQFSEFHLNMPEIFNSQLRRVISAIDNLKRETARSCYQWEDAVAEISNIVAATPRLLGFPPQPRRLPFRTTLLFELLPPQDVYQTEISPALALAAEYHLLLLRRCMQQLSLFGWFRSRYVIEELQENPSFTSEQVNGAMAEIADMAEYILCAYDAYEKAVGQSDDSRLPDKEREQCEALIVQGRNHLVGTWYDVLQENFNEYIMNVESAIADVENLDYSAGVDSLASIQLVDKIPLKVHQLISAYPVPENLPPRYL